MLENLEQKRNSEVKKPEIKATVEKEVPKGKELTGKETVKKIEQKKSLNDLEIIPERPQSPRYQAPTI